MRRAIEDECVEREMPFARKIAHRYVGRGLAREDIEQVAYLGLVKAVRRFDPGRGEPFHGYGAVTIRGEVQRHFRDAGWAVRPPRRLQELQTRVWDAELRLVEALRRSPTLAEVAAEAGVDEQAALEALSLTTCFRTRSLDVPIGDDGRASLADLVGTTEEGFELAETRAVLARANLTLSARDRKILRLRYVEGMTQQQIGDEIGVTQMQVSRLLARIIRDLRRVLLQDDAAA